MAFLAAKVARNTMKQQSKAMLGSRSEVSKKSPVRARARRASVPPEEDLKRGGPRRLLADERRAQLVDVAEDLFKSRAYAEIGMADVAKAAGITPGLVYHYFPSKEALFMAAYEVRTQELLRFCRPDPLLPFTEQIERGVRGYLDFVEAHGIAYLNLFRSPAVSEPGFQRICEQTREVIVDNFVAALQDNDLARPVALRLSLRGYLGYSEAAILLWLERRCVSRPTLERMLFSAILAAVRIGMASEPEPMMSEADGSALEQHYRRHFGLP
jgi:AcrR family transcriptional regulator